MQMPPPSRAREVRMLPHRREEPRRYMLRRALETPLRSDVQDPITLGTWMEQLQKHALPALDAPMRQQFWQPVFHGSMQQFTEAITLIRHVHHGWPMPSWYEGQRDHALTHAYRYIKRALAGLNEIARAGEQVGQHLPGQLEQIDALTMDIDKTFTQAAHDYAQWASHSYHPSR